ncbi:hypothetical protein B0H17DRAFT_1151595 [Mycena rosella]|uniref:Uncharacterized protein n=1 Tax=Mycena rosella TaxID=1033263 RepID=A0AAD7BJ71_MYCRO|nr:hypothetical protein B0H17DRAFT_1151595 [Mycena rosella]
MSDSSFDPSSECPGISQHHTEQYEEGKRQRREARAAANPNKRSKTHSKTHSTSADLESPIKQESSSPGATPRLTALKANELLAEQYNGPLNSQMGENINTYIESLLEATSRARSSSPLDGADIDLLRMQCLDMRAERDAAIEARNDAVEALSELMEKLARMKTTFDQVICERDAAEEARDTVIGERDNALNKLTRWNEAAVAAAEFARLASEQVWISRGY